MRLNHLGLPVRDERRSQQFYSAYFGFDPAAAQEYPDGTVIIRNADGFDPALHPVEHTEPLATFLHAGFKAAGPADVRTLTSIPGQIIELKFGARRSLPWREPEPEDASVPSGDRGLQVGESGVDEGGVVAAQVQRAGDAGRVDVQGAGGVEEVPPEGFGCGMLVPGQLERQ